MPNNHKKRTALVTGASRGLGRAIALALASEGADLIICARGEKNLRSVQMEILEQGVKVTARVVDGTSASDVEKFFKDIGDHPGKLDVLVNNIGGVEKYGGFLDLNPSDWHRALDLNLMSMVYFTQFSLPLLKLSLAPRIINICTVPARQPGAYNPHYSAAKAAMLNLSKHLANLLAKDGILVNAVCPASIRSEAWEKKVAKRAVSGHISLAEAKTLQEQEDRDKVPLGRIAKPEEIARAVTFLASDEASYITGTCLNVDGGTVKSIF